MGYDDWKLRSPDDELPEEECYHEEHEITWEGRATCNRCGNTWWATADEIRFQREASEAYDAYCRREERRERWRQVREWFRSFLPRRKPKPALIDDEIPF